MPSARSKPSLLVALTLAVLAALLPASLSRGRVGVVGAGFADGCCCCAETVSAVCCCVSSGACGAEPDATSGPTLVDGCCGSGGGADLALASGVRFLATPNPSPSLILFLPMRRPWSAVTAAQPEAAPVDTPSPVPRFVDTAHAA